MNNLDLKPNSANFDNSPDIYVKNGQLSRNTGNDQIAQLITTRLRTFMGEYFLDQTLGVPWVQTIFEKPANTAVFDSIIKKVILGTVGVVSLASFQSDIQGRTYSVVFTALDADGVSLDLNFSFTPQPTT